MDIVVRKFSLNDIDLLRDLHEVAAALHRDALPKRFRQPPPAFFAKLLSDISTDHSSKLFVAERDGEILGYVRVVIKELPDHPLIHSGKFISVEELAVSPSARRKRVGTQLMAFAEKFAKELGFPEIELNVWKFNHEAEQFYSQLGYLPIRTSFAKKFAE